MGQLAKVYGQFAEAGGQLWAISPQPAPLNQALRQRYDLPFPVLADEEQAVIRAWGLFNDLDPKQRPIPYPATYIVAPGGRIAWHYLGLAARDRPAVGQIVAALRQVAAV